MEQVEVSNKLQLKDLFIGSTDAKNELLENSSKEIKAFKQGFLMPDNVVLSDFFCGKKFYITGLKGTGKTALLRYLSICVEERLHSDTTFILFKSDLREDERAKLTKTAEIVNRRGVDVEQYRDYESAWLLFLFHRLIHICDEHKICVFDDDINWRKFRKKVLEVYDLEEETSRIVPVINKGKVSVDAKVIRAEADVEMVKRVGDNKSDIKVASLVGECEELFKELIPGKDPLYMFLDELELSLVSKKQYQRDIEMIRDLILAIYKINSISRKRNYGLFLITGVRKEVLATTMSIGKEINKPIADFGINLRWQQSGGNLSEHPLIKIIIKRLLSAESVLKKSDRASEKNIWSRYFPDTINGKPAEAFILNRTWYRPRDIVRLLGIARQQFPYKNYFSHEIFDAINKDFSVDSWTEQEEELQSRYSKNQINGIKHLLMGVSCPFTLQEISEKAASAKMHYKDVDELLKEHSISDLLDHLYSLGVVGNTGKKSMRYSFRGDDGLLLEKKMTIHPALWNVLSVTKKS